MIRTHLIQRLQKPANNGNSPIGKMIDSLSFGGGLINGGLSQEAMGLLRSILRFDYMGSAEFEFGAVPQSLYNIFEYSKKGLLKKSEAVFGEIKFKKPVYYLCRKEDEEEVKRRITHLATKGDFKPDNTISLKEYSHLKDSIEKEEDIHMAFGWLELDNDFMFFTDKEMFHKILILFGLKKGEIN